MNLTLNIKREHAIRRAKGDGIQYIFEMPNGYKASVIKDTLSYGYEEDLWELAILKDGKCCYDTPITNDVLGCLTDAEVKDILTQIENFANGKPYTVPPVKHVPTMSEILARAFQ